MIKMSTKKFHNDNKTVAGDLNLNNLAEKNHASLANKNTEANVKHLTDAQVTALHTIVVAGDLSHNDLANLNAGDVYEHISAAQLAALHAKQHAMDNATEHTSSDITTLNASTTKHGFLKKLDNNALNFINGQGNWAEPAGVGGISEADVFAIEAIGIANKRWKPLSVQLSNDVLFSANGFANTGANDMGLQMHIPLPFVKGGHNLVITQMRIGIISANASNYIGYIRLRGATTADPPVVSILDTSGAYNTPGVKTWNFDDITLGGVHRELWAQVRCYNSAANYLEIAYIDVEYYYTE